MEEGHAVAGPISSGWPGMRKRDRQTQRDRQTKTETHRETERVREKVRRGGQSRARYSLQEHTHTDLLPPVRPYSEVSSNSPGEYKPGGQLMCKPLHPTLGPEDLWPSHNARCICSTSKSPRSVNSSSIVQKLKSQVSSETQGELLAWGKSFKTQQSEP